jgi:hypothetical protein
MKCTLFSPGISISSTKIADLHHIMWYLAEKQQVSALVFGLVGHKKKNKSTTALKVSMLNITPLRGKHAKHYTTEVFQ